MTVSANLFSRKFARRIVKSVAEQVLPLAERLTHFETAKGDYLPNRVRMLLGSYEAEERRLMGGFLRRGQIVLDVGANVGYLTRFFARRTGATGTVYAFEPNPVVFALLQRNTASLPQVSAFNIGLSSDSAESELFLAGNDHSVGSFCAAYPASHVLYQETGRLHSLPAKLRSGDEFLTEQDTNKIDILKIDVEGWELNVLRGLEKTITRSPHIAIFCELNRAAQECTGHDPEELPGWFLDRNFALAAPHRGALRELTRESIREWIEQLPAPGYATLFASRG